MFRIRLKQLRNEKKLTQEELANKLGLGQSAINNYENSNREPEYSLLVKIADVLDCSIDYLLGRTDKKDEILRNPDIYEIVITKAKDYHISPESLDKYIEILKTEIDKK